MTSGESHSKIQTAPPKGRGPCKLNNEEKKAPDKGNGDIAKDGKELPDLSGSGCQLRGRARIKVLSYGRNSSVKV